jgi:hypothetical protein
MQGLLARMKSAPPEQVSQVFIPRENILPTPPAGDEPFRAGEHYFTVRLTALELADGREWFTSYLPLVTTACEFIYAGAPTAVPFAVGPSLVVPEGSGPPRRVGLVDTRVCGVQPYRGGDVTVSVMLSRVATENRLARLVGVIERASQLLKAAAVVVPYLAVADLIASGLGELAEDGGTAPLLAGRISLSQDNGSFRPGYLLVTAGDASPERTWIVDGKVSVGATAVEAAPLRADHVLLSLEQAAARSDAESLPLVGRYWPHIDDLSGRNDKESWSTAKSWLSVLAQELYLSPDLTRGQAESLYATFAERARSRRDQAEMVGHLGPADEDELQVLKNIDHAVRAL